MKKLLIPLLLFMLVGCAVAKVTIGMSEQQFVKEHRHAWKVELSEYRTVYKESPGKFYYFREGKLYLMDEGRIAHGTNVSEPSQ